METKQEIREFPNSRRARITPEQAGLQSYGSRRVLGLCREEVAVLAGVSDSELYAAPARPVNTARFVFLDPRAEASFGDWERIATEPGSRSEEALKLLGSWAATVDPAESSRASDYR